MKEKRAPGNLLPFLLILVLISGLVPMSAMAEEMPAYTIMVYMCGTDLESEEGSATDDILEMLSAGLTPDGPVQVVIETGGTKEWYLEEVDADKNERWLVRGDTLVLADEQDRQNMGDAGTLQSFLEFGIMNFPAQQYALILWDHGGGATSGVCFDEYTDDYLTMSEIHEALERANAAVGGFPLRFVGFDACLMATIEMANHLKDYASYMIASEELEPGSGWDYATWLWYLEQDPFMDTETLGSIIVDSFVETNLENDPYDYVTLSMLDLSKIDAVTSELENIGAGLSEALESGELRAISRKRQNMRSFGDFTEDNTSDMVDLYHFAQVFADLSGVDIGAFESALDEAVVYSRYSDNLDHVGGISILLPLETRESFQEYSDAYDEEKMYPCYTDFITGYTEMMNGGNYVFTQSAPEQITMDQQEQDDSLNLPEGYNEDGVFAYSMALSAEDMENLAYVEGNLMLDVSEKDFESYIDLGYLQDAQIDWDNGVVYSMFDGSWPILEGQFVCITDQSVTEKVRRSLIDVTVNGEEKYLLVIFDEAHPQGEVIGYTQGYNEAGLPVRGYEKLKAGDIIVPMYDMLYWDEQDNEQYESFEGEPITVTEEPLAFGYEDLAGGDLEYVYSFCLNDIFGDYQFSDFILFTL